jgi:hypothetical protein
VFTLLPIVAITWAWQQGAVNVPKWDDHVFKAFLLSLDKETTLWGSFRQFVKQHNEHRIAYDRLLVWLDYHLFGKFSYVRLMAYGNLGLLGLVALFATYLARYTRLWYIFLPPVVLFIVSLANWENLYWALSAMQNFGIVVWSLWAFYALSYHRRPWVAIALAAVATLVSGNGFLVWPVGVVLLLAQRRFRALLPWLGAAGLLIVLYFHDYVQPQSVPPARGSVIDLLMGWLAYVGAAANALPLPGSYWLCAGLGTLLLAFWVYAFVRNWPALQARTGWSAREAFVFSSVAFIIGTAAVVVWSRYGYGRDLLITSRYRIYSLTLLVFSYTYWLSAFYKGKPWPAALGGLAVSGLLWWSAFVVNAHDALVLRHFLLAKEQYNWTYPTNRPTSALDANTRRLIDNAPAYYDLALPAFFAPAKGAAFPVDSVFKSDGIYSVRLPARGVAQVGYPSLVQPDRGVSVLLRSAQRTYLYNAVPTPHTNWRILFGTIPRYVTDAPAEAHIEAADILPGTYSVSIVARLADGTCQVHPTGRLLTAAPYTAVTRPLSNW